MLTARQGGRGPAQTWWVAKTKGGVYIPPNKPLTRLADLKAMHAGQTNWTEVVVKAPEDEAYYYYNSAAPGTKFGRRMHPDTGTLMVVERARCISTSQGRIRLPLLAVPS